jgi:hypothetical protein
MKLQYIKPSTIRLLAKQNGKRVSKDFLQALDRYLQRKVEIACTEHNGGKKTLDSGLAAYYLGNR